MQLCLNRSIRCGSKVQVFDRNPILAVLALSAAAAWLPVQAAEPSGDDAPAAALEPAAASAGPEAEAAAQEPDPTDDLCDVEPPVDAVQEKIRAGIHEGSCRSVRWFDGLFGEEQDFPEETLGGKLSTGFAWNQYEGFKPRLRFRLQAQLPNMSERWDAFFGRVDEENYIAGSETYQDSAFRQGISDEEDEWLFGLGYKGRGKRKSPLDFTVGIRLGTPPRVYARGRYSKLFPLSPTADLRFQQSLFWRDGLGWGTTSRLDSISQFRTNDVLRWEAIGRWTEETEGVKWLVANTWFHQLSKRRGISLRTFVRGETKADVALQEYGFEFNWRRELTREWLFINLGPTLTWPREKLEEKREASLGFALLFELYFGIFRD